MSVDGGPRAHALVLLDRDARIVHANEKALRYARVAFQREMRVGDSMLLFMADGAHDGFVQNLERAFAGEPCAVRKALSYPTGLTLHFECFYEPLVVDGAVRFVAFSAQNGTRDTLERERLHLFARSLEQARDGVVLCSATGDLPIVWVNEGFERLTGWALDEVAGRNCRFLQDGDGDQPGVRAMRHAIREGKSCDVVVRNRRRDGSVFLNHIQLTPIREAESITHYVAFQREVSRSEFDARALARNVVDELAKLATSDNLAQALERAQVLSEWLRAFASARDDATERPAEGTSATVLLVDDEVGIRSLLAEKLRRTGYRVLEAGTASEAIARIDEETAVLVTDVALPDADHDVPVVHAYRARHPDRPIVLITGFVGPELHAVTSAPNVSVLTKPFPVRALLDRLEQVLRREGREANPLPLQER